MFGRLIPILALLAAPLFAANPAAPQVILEQGSNHWAFQKIQKPRIEAEGANAIDALVAVRLSKERLALSREASRRVLIRRLYLDLIGFPPEPEEVEAFVRDRDAMAYQK